MASHAVKCHFLSGVVQGTARSALCLDISGAFDSVVREVLFAGGPPGSFSKVRCVKLRSLKTWCGSSWCSFLKRTPFMKQASRLI